MFSGLGFVIWLLAPVAWALVWLRLFSGLYICGWFWLGGGCNDFLGFPVCLRLPGIGRRVVLVYVYVVCFEFGCAGRGILRWFPGALC